MKEIYKELLIFSMFQNNSNSNELNHILEMKELDKKGITYKPIITYDKGERNISLMVLGHEHIDTVKILCKLYKQSHFLMSHNDRMSYLVNPNDDTQAYVGTLQEIEPDEVLGLKNYIQLDGKYYAAKV